MTTVALLTAGLLWSGDVSSRAQAAGFSAAQRIHDRLNSRERYEAIRLAREKTASMQEHDRLSPKGPPAELAAPAPGVILASPPVPSTRNASAKGQKAASSFHIPAKAPIRQEEQTSYTFGLQLTGGLSDVAPGALSDQVKKFLRPDPETSGRMPEAGTQRNVKGESRAVDWALSQGMNVANERLEGAFASTGGTAAFDFRLDRKGRLAGAGDALLPLHNAENSVLYARMGARAPAGEEWIGNAGIGRRWFVMAEEDGPDLMLGCDLFLDYDAVRDNTRGGAGMEGQYRWITATANVYAPLSSWKARSGFDGSTNADEDEKLPAGGWDAQVTAYAPFHRALAFTGAYSRWKSDGADVFGEDLRGKSAEVWSYGLKYAPLPLVSGYLRHTRSGRNPDDAEFGLRLSLQFDMPWAEQCRPPTTSSGAEEAHGPLSSLPPGDKLPSARPARSFSPKQTIDNMLHRQKVFYPLPIPPASPSPPP